MKVLVVFWLIHSIHQSASFSYKDMYDVKMELLKEYKKTIRPVLNQSKPIHLYADLRVRNILSFNEREGVLKINVALGLMWIDEILRWNTTEIPFPYLYFAVDSVWIPKLYLQNSATEDVAIKMGDPTERKTLHFANGNVLYLESGLATTRCDADIFYYPFDQHSCDLDVFSELIVEYMTLGARDFNYEFPLDSNKEWIIVEISKKNATTIIANTLKYDRVIFTIKFKRKPTFLILNILTPIIGLGLINPVVFVLPESSGERVSLAVTILLTVVFFLNVVADRLPPISDPISMLNISIMTQIVFSLLILIFTILTMIIFDKAGKNTPIPKTGRKLILTLKYFANKRGKNKVSNNLTGERLKRQLEGNFEQKNNEVTNGEPGENTQEDQINNHDLFTWQELGNLTNKACWRVFLLLIVVNWVLYFCMMVVAINGTM